MKMKTSDLSSTPATAAEDKQDRQRGRPPYGHD